MRKRWLGIFALCALAVLGIPAGAPHVEAAAPPPAPAADNFVVVQFASGVSAQAQRADGKGPSLEQQGFRQLPVPPGKTTAQFLSELKARPDVISAERDPVVQAAEIPDDPLYGRNQDAYLSQISAPAAWNLSTGNGKVVVAVLDSGLDTAHPDFAGRIWTNPNDAYSDGVDHDGNGCANDFNGCRFVTYTSFNRDACNYNSSAATGDIRDDSGTPQSPGAHGTFVSGIIGAAGNNGIGVSGVAWNIKLMPIKVLDCGSGLGHKPSGLMSDVAKGIDYARLMGANIINLSLSSYLPEDNTKQLRTAIQQAQDAGIIIVVAAGNITDASQPGPGYPGAYTEFPNLITVGASNQNNGNTWASFSTYGPALDFAAPGDRGIVSTLRSDLGAGLYASSDGGGTSYATPMVSGMFALMMSRNTRLSAADLIQIARDTATPAAPAPHGQNWAGAGIINIGAAVARVPMLLTGSALRDWKDVAAGTDIRATIDGNNCGATTTLASGAISIYTLRVKTAAEIPGCGQPGKTVQLSIAGATAQQTMIWGGRDVVLGKSMDINSVSPPPGAVVVQTLNGGWSNIANFDGPGTLPTAFSNLPAPWTAAYHWDTALSSLGTIPGAFERYLPGAPTYVNNWTQVQLYDTYWVNAPATNIASVNPNPQPGRVIPLNIGWNNFAYTGTSKEVKNALQEVAGKYTEVLQYDNASRTWLIHAPGQPRYLQDFNGLFKLKVYWIYMTQPGAITMS